jgi:hypothetical protein
MSDAKSVISNLYLNKTETKPSEIHEEIKPFVSQPLEVQMPFNIPASRECLRTGIAQRRNGVFDLAQYLEAWYNQRGQAVQLDGSRSYRSNPAPWVYFNYQGRVYKLAGDTKDRAIKSFLDRVQNTSDYDSVFDLAIGKKGNPVLRLSGLIKAEGWYCTKG